MTSRRKFGCRRERFAGSSRNSVTVSKASWPRTESTMSTQEPTGEYRFQPLPVDKIVYQFEKAFRAGQAPALDAFLEGDGPARWQLLLELIHSELELRLQGGQ